MLRAAHIFEIEILVAHLRHGAGISENVPPGALRENYSQTGLPVSNAPHARNVHSAFSQALKAGLCKRVASHRGAKAHLIAKQSEIVSEDCRGAT